MPVASASSSISRIATHKIVTQGLEILTHLAHRGAVGADPLAGRRRRHSDSAARRLFARRGARLEASPCRSTALMASACSSCRRTRPLAPSAKPSSKTTVDGRRSDFAGLARRAGGQFDALGESVKALRAGDAPDLRRQGAATGRAGRLRAQAVRHPQADHHNTAAERLGDRGTDFYTPSLSSRTLVYKGMLLADQVGVYYKDLADERLGLGAGPGASALLHQYLPEVEPGSSLPHDLPQRRDQHACAAIYNWMAARRWRHEVGSAGRRSGQAVAADLRRPVGFRLLSTMRSELLVQGGYSLAHAMMMLIPEAWAGNPLMDEERRASTNITPR